MVLWQELVQIETVCEIFCRTQGIALYNERGSMSGYRDFFKVFQLNLGRGESSRKGLAQPPTGPLGQLAMSAVVIPS